MGLRRHVALLRAINVGGYGLVKMDALRAAFAAAGCRNVRTFIASGNVVFDAPRPLAALRPLIEKRVGALLEARPVIMYRPLLDLKRIVETAPFGALVGDKEVKVYVAFLAGKPAKKVSFPLSLPKEGLEAPGLVKGAVLIVSRRKPSGWYGFPANWIEKELGVAVTARTWSTVTKLLAFGKQ
jgi:uncharacterized protein (DUF1697 family)